ncbi:MAG: alpha/beta fold hydrolase [Candidatus Nanohaloarchaea archaeon]|nr:alpha/beta fold hydrolase [Candidatus Nanohaloarchaea archaeon]
MRTEERCLGIDGEEVAAVVHRPDAAPERAVVFAHGFGSDKAGSYERRATMAAEEGFLAIRFDFRGNNESSREFHEATLSTRIADLRRVVDEVEDLAVGVYGSSFGGLVALHAAARDERIDALALRAPVTFLSVLDDIRSTIEEDGRYEQLPGKWVDDRFLDDLDGYSTEAIVEDIAVPTLIMHGGEDDVVDPGSSRRFFDALSCEKEYVMFDGEGHRFGDAADDEAVRRALSWFDARM